MTQRELVTMLHKAVIMQTAEIERLHLMLDQKQASFDTALGYADALLAHCIKHSPAYQEQEHGG